MGLYDDIESLISANPNITEKDLNLRLAQMRRDKQTQAKRLFRPDPQLDADLSDYMKMDMPDFEKKFLKGAIQHEAQKSRLAPGAADYPSVLDNKSAGRSVKDFAGEAWKNISPFNMAESAITVVLSPRTALQNAADAHGATFDKANTSLEQGDFPQALRHSINSLIPLVGPQMDEYQDSLRRGNRAEPLGGLLGLGGAAVMGPKIARGASKIAKPIIKYKTGDKIGAFLDFLEYMHGRKGKKAPVPEPPPQSAPGPTAPQAPVDLNPSVEFGPAPARPQPPPPQAQAPAPQAPPSPAPAPTPQPTQAAPPPPWKPLTTEEKLGVLDPKIGEAILARREKMKTMLPDELNDYDSIPNNPVTEPVVEPLGRTEPPINNELRQLFERMRTRGNEGTLGSGEVSIPKAPTVAPNTILTPKTTTKLAPKAAPKGATTPKSFEKATPLELQLEKSVLHVKIAKGVATPAEIARFKELNK